ncbi:MAG: O-antigen ligase family protein [Oscillospiraceae bacterium]|nr:O-antigen ligase family protein [Oscillospiraceae bacterium]
MEFDVLGGSVLYRLLGRILDGLTEAARKSATGRMVMWIIRTFGAWAHTSLIVRGITWVADGFGRGIQNSAIIAWLLREDEAGRYKERGIFFRIYWALLGLFRRIYRALRLDKLFTGSIFLKPWLWAALVMAVLPVAPTMAVLGVVLVSALSLTLVMLQDKDRTLAYASINKYVWLYMFVYALATLASVTFRGSLPVGLITVSFVGFFHVLMSGIETRRQVRLLLGVMVGIGAVVSAYGILQFINPAEFGNTWLDDEMFDFVRVYSTLANPNVLGTYLLLITPLAFGGMLMSKTNQGRLYFLGSAGLMCLCLVLTYSRGAYLGFLFAAAVFLVLLDRRFIIPGILAVIVILFAMPEAVLARFFSVGDLGDTSTSFRVFIWMGTISMLQDYWFSGVGPGEAAWGMVYPAYAFHAIVSPHSHNLFLQIMVDAGAPGLAVFLGVLFQYFKATFAALRRKVQGPQRMLIIAAIASVAGFLVQAMTDYIFYNFRVMLFFWGVLAVGILATRYDKLREGGEAP